MPLPPYRPVTTATELSILVIDDDTELCQLLSQYLGSEGYRVEAAHKGTIGVDRALSGEHALIVLDVMLPDVQGFEVLRRVRARSRAPVLMLTARGDEHDRILGLQMGADDYLAKPFNPRELCARIEAILRRAQPDIGSGQAAHTSHLSVDDVTIDRGARTVECRGRLIDLTTVEFDLLIAFLQSAGRAIARDELVRTVLSREFSAFDRSIDTHVSNLRRKLGPSVRGRDRITSVRGIGYQYVSHNRPDGESR